ncbi:MAG TPA: hypothetical protein VLT36_06935 [Candidatus Dormibacteraeota bacterium]|nr:hypothetical protein [Candidatus Dormibacteraeota bacterium]
MLQDIGLVIALIIIGLLVRFTHRFWQRHDLDGPDFTRREFAAWAVKGMVLPIAVWLLIHANISSRFPALLGNYAALPSGSGARSHFWVGLLGSGVFVAGSYWAAITFLWFLASHALEFETSRADLIGAGLLWPLVAALPCALLVYIGGWSTVGLATVIIVSSVLRDLLAIGNPRKKIRRPVYERALKKIEAGKFGSAEKEVLRQLEKCESDYTGWMLLAELYATRFNDLPEAEGLILELCRQSETTRQQMSDALHRLADWQLEIGKDPRAARRTLDQIRRAFPASHYGDVAERRLAALQLTGG